MLTMLVLCSNVSQFTYVSVRHEWSLEQLGRHINIVIIIIKNEYWKILTNPEIVTDKQIGGWQVLVHVCARAFVCLKNLKVCDRFAIILVSHILLSFPLLRDNNLILMCLIHSTDSDWWQCWLCAEKRADPNGRVYFVNHKNRTTQWEDPRTQGWGTKIIFGHPGPLLW